MLSLKGRGHYNVHFLKWPTIGITLCKKIVVLVTVVSEYNGPRKYWDYEFTLYAMHRIRSPP